MKQVLRLILFFFIPACACNTNQIDTTKRTKDSLKGKISPNEDRAIKEIIGFYGGTCEYGFENTISGSTSASETSFWIKFSNSADIDSLKHIAELPASNMAYIFYKNLQEEKNKYDRIRVELSFKDGQSTEYSYSLPQLETAKNKIQLVLMIVSLIKSKDFNSIATHIKTDTSLFNYDKIGLLDRISNAEPDFGHIKNYIPYGFKFSKVKGKDLLHISGLVVRDKKSHYLSVNLDPNSKDDEIYTLGYSL